MAPSSSALYKRAATVQVGTIKIDAGGTSALDVAFRIQKGVHITKNSCKPQPNTCDLRIYNLSTDHQKELEQATTPTPGAPPKVVACSISAGYVGRQSLIFSGQLRGANTVTDGATDVTELTTGDGDKALAQSRMSIALGPGTSGAAGMKKILASLGVGDGNLSKALALLQAQPLAASLFNAGVLLKGSAAELMTDFCRSCGLEWSIQNGALQVTDLNAPLDGEAVLVDAQHGMVGSPTVDTRGILSVTTLMIPDLAPGVKIAVNTPHLKGGYRIIHVEWKGSTFENDWYCHLEAQRY